MGDINSKITTRKDGYQVFSLKGKITYVHRFLAEKYIPNPDNLPCVNHKDGNPSNNSIENLEWTTRRDNCEHARLNGLSENKSQGIKNITFELYLKIFELRKQNLSFYKIGEILGLDRRRINAIYNGDRYKDYYNKMKEVNYV